MEQTLFAKLWLFLASLLPAAFGAAMSLHFSKTDSSIGNKIFTYISGIVIAYYIGGALIEYFHIQPLSFIASAIQLTWGVLGMSFFTQLQVQLPDFISALKDKLTGK